MACTGIESELAAMRSQNLSTVAQHMAEWARMLEIDGRLVISDQAAGAAANRFHGSQGSEHIEETHPPQLRNVYRQ
jgi:hypothetical protein